MWCVPKLTEKFIRKMDDVLDIYARDYDPAKPVICLDEKTTQLLSTPRGSVAAKPGSVKKVDYEYKRNGTANIFVSIEPQVGKRYLKVTSRRTANDFAEFLNDLVMKKYQRAEKVILVMDNLNTHRETSLVARYGEKKAAIINQRIEWHYSPEHASWLNMAEMEIGKVTKKVLGKRIQTQEHLRQEVAAYEKVQNKLKPTINWKFTKEKAYAKFKLSEN